MARRVGILGARRRGIEHQARQGGRTIEQTPAPLGIGAGEHAVQ